MAHAPSMLLGAVLFTACASISDAAVFMPGDLFVATQSGHVQWRDPTGANYSPIRVINTGDFGQQAGMRHSPLTHDLWITNFNAYPPGPPPSVRIVDTTGTPIGSTSTPAQNYPESIVFDANGNAYVGGPQGALVELNAAGSIVTSFTLPVTDGAEGPDWIDLAADQSTIFYSYERQIIKRYDLGGGNPLADFADLSSIMAPGARLYSLRLLPDGGLLIAGGSVVYRLNSLGAVTQTYDVPSEDFFFSLALTPDALSFWTGSLGNNLGAFNVYEFSIASGVLQHSFNAGLPVGGLAVFGDYGEAGRNGVPEPGTLALLGIAVASLAWRRRVHPQPSRRAWSTLRRYSPP